MKIPLKKPTHSKTLVLAGDFSLGEKINNTQLKCISAALSYKADIGVVVNNIDFEKKLKYLVYLGKKAFIKHYCGNAKCSSMPVCDILTPSQVNELVDWRQYDQLAKLIKKNKKNKLSDLIKNKVEPRLIKSHLKKYSLNPNDTIIFWEKQLRNYAAKQLNRPGTRGWQDVVNKIILPTPLSSPFSHAPLCSSINLALFEKIKSLGFTRVIQIENIKDKPSIESGTKIYKLLHKKFPKDKRWSLKITNRYI